MPSDHVEYVHRAGRAGRTGSSVPGTVTTIVTPSDVPELLDMVRALNVSAEAADFAPGGTSTMTAATLTEDGGAPVELEASIKQLEDVFNLY